MKTPIPESDVTFATDAEAQAWCVFYAAQCPVIAHVTNRENVLELAALSADRMLAAFRARVAR